MTVLLPLYLLKLRKAIAKNPTSENGGKLRDLIYEIIGTIKTSNEKGLITNEDKVVLNSLTRKIYDYLYENIELYKEEGVSKVFDEELVLDIDIALMEGREEGREEVASVMLKEGEDIEKIIKFTRLPLEKIMALSN
jgi:hypothetical protein